MVAIYNLERNPKLSSKKKSSKKQFVNLMKVDKESLELFQKKFLILYFTNPTFSISNGLARYVDPLEQQKSTYSLGSYSYSNIKTAKNLNCLFKKKKIILEIFSCCIL